jgi:hypothetical protein
LRSCAWPIDLIGAVISLDPAHLCRAAQSSQRTDRHPALTLQQSARAARISIACCSAIFYTGAKGMERRHAASQIAAALAVSVFCRSHMLSLSPRRPAEQAVIPARVFFSVSRHKIRVYYLFRQQTSEPQADREPMAPTVWRGACPAAEAERCPGRCLPLPCPAYRLPTRKKRSISSFDFSLH